MTYIIEKNSQEFVFDDVFAKRIMEAPRSFISFEYPVACCGDENFPR